MDISELRNPAVGRVFEDAAESYLANCSDWGTRSILGFDLVHAWRNFGKIREGGCRVDSHGISVFIDLAAFPVDAAERQTKIIAQTIWLFDRWKRFGGAEKMVYFAVSRTGGYHYCPFAGESQSRARAVPHNRSELVLFGISAEEKKKPDRGIWPATAPHFDRK